MKQRGFFLLALVLCVTTPVLHLLPDDSELTLDQLLSEPVSDSVPIDEYRQYRQRNRS